MLTEDKYNAVVALRDSGESRKHATRTTGVSRGTVASIFNGTYHCGSKTRKLASVRKQFESTIPKGEFVRCPGCGGMVQMPCLLCYIDDGKRITSGVPNVSIRRCQQCGKTKPELEAFKTIDGVITRTAICNRCAGRVSRSILRQRNSSMRDRRFRNES